MKCPFCDFEDSKVINSRSCQDGAAIRRRRECQKCAKRFTTYEHVEYLPTQVIKKNGEREPFDREKVLKGLQIACRKRNVTFEDIERVVAEVESHVQNSIEKEIQAGEIGELILNKLKDLDQVAYVRFASVYREFADIAGFSEEIKALLSKQK